MPVQSVHPIVLHTLYQLYIPGILINVVE